jgi:hypothetical protein
LIGLYEPGASPDILFTGYLPPGTPAERLTGTGRAQYLRWNVHPCFSDNLDIVRSVGAQIIVPAFGGPKAEDWAKAFSPAQVVLSRTVSL